MRIIHIALFAFLTTLVFSSCGGKVVRQKGQQVTVRVEQTTTDGPRLVRLEVMGEKIIRVTATVEDKFADRPSLIIVPQDQKVNYELVENGDTVRVKTAFVVANVLRSNGKVWFTNLKGDIILTEQAEGSKTFSPFSTTQTVWTANGDGPAEVPNPTTWKGWSTRVVFESPADEAFYGLGQHQADDWNYKGKNEELFQYNTKVSVPFVVSSRNYGVLVDSYSLMRFGNPKDYSQLPALFDLYDKDGVEGALTGTYTAPGEETLVRREDSIYFENLASAKNLPRYRLDKAQVTYEGEIVPRVTG